MNLLFLNLGTSEIIMIGIVTFIFILIGIAYGYTIYLIVVNKALTPIKKFLWFLLVIWLPLLGVLLYWTFGSQIESFKQRNGEPNNI